MGTGTPISPRGDWHNDFATRGLAHRFRHAGTGTPISPDDNLHFAMYLDRRNRGACHRQILRYFHKPFDNLIPIWHNIAGACSPAKNDW